MEKYIGYFRSFYRLLLFAFMMILFLASAYCIYLATPNEQKRRTRFYWHAGWWARLCCRLFRIKIITKGNTDPNEPGLVVCNHMGFIDILALAAVRPNLFVTSQEMRQTPVLGTITEMGGCLYVERRSRTKILAELDSIAEVLKTGLRVVLYPEATSTNGEQILPFKRTLLMAAAKAGVPVIPVVFNFREINGEKGFLYKYRDSVCWYGDIGFHTSIVRAFSLKSLVCELEFLPPVYTSLEQDRGVVADSIHEMISTRFVPVHA